MADLSTMFPQSDLPGLSGIMQGEQFNIAKRNAQLNQQNYLQEMMQQQALNPLALQEKQAQIDSHRASARNTNALAAGHEYDQKEKEWLQEPARQAALAEYASKHSKAELDLVHSRVEREMMSPDPKIREGARKMYMLTGEMVKLAEQKRLERENSMAEIGAREEAAKRTKAANEGDQKSRYEKFLMSTKGDAAKSLNILLQGVEMFKSTDPAYAAELGARAEQAKRVVEADPRRAGSPWTVDPATGRYVPNPTALPPVPGPTPNNQDPYANFRIK